jgi:hypothetical protein
MSMWKKTRKNTPYYPRKYYAGLSQKQKTRRLKEIKRFGSMSWKSRKAYKGFQTDRGVKTRKSSYVQKLARVLPGVTSLTEKAKLTGVPRQILEECYNRGMAAWRTGHRPGATEQQWGHARVASLLVCGKTHYGPDSDLVRKAKTRSVKARRWWSKQCHI